MEWELTAWVVPTVFWIFVGAVILVPVSLRSRERRMFYMTPCANRLAKKANLLHPN